MLKPILNRINLFFHANKEICFALYQILGFIPKDLSLYEEALLHQSSSQEQKNKHTRYHNNERLEFLGDAILNAIVAEIVFQKFPEHNEGFLTNTRSKMVQRESMDKIAVEMGLLRLVRHSAIISKQKNHIGGNALEAFIGAIYLDQGYRKTRQFIEDRIIHPYINLEELAKKEVNFKSKLLEWCQKNRVEMRFEINRKSIDHEHNLIFYTQALLNEVSAGTGSGSSKKEAHQKAAEMSLQMIKTNTEFVREILAAKPPVNTPANQATEQSADDIEEEIHPIATPCGG